MNHRFSALAFVAFGILAVPGRADEPPTFERDIKPLFAKRCTVCHNPKKLDDLDVSAGLALDTFEATLTGANGRAIVVAGKPAESELVRRLSVADDEKRMPLLDKPLPETQRELVARWIAAGAPRGVPSPEAQAAPKSIRRIVRSLDVAFALEAKVPAGVEGMGAGGAVQVLLKVGPLPAITALAFRGDGRQLAVGTNGVVVVWDLADARPALCMTELPGAVHALAFSRDGKRLAVGSGLPARSGSVRVYSVPDGTLIHDFEGHGDVVVGLAFRPDGGQLASASFDQTVRLWNLALGRPDGVFRGHSDFVYDVAYTRDGRSLLSASKDRSVKRISAKTVKEERTYSDHDDDVLAVAVQPVDGRFVTAGNEPQLRWWPLDAEKPTLRNGGHSGPVHQLAFSGSGTRLISAGGDGTVRLWDGISGVFQKTLAGPTEWQYAVALSDDGKRAAAGGWDGLVRLWDADAGTLLATLIQPPGPTGSEWLAVAPSGYFAASPALAKLARWKVGNAEVALDLPLSVLGRPEEVAHALRGEPVAAITFATPKK